LGCPFCGADDRVVDENELAFVIEDGYAVTDGHSLIIPRRHVADYFDLHQSERNAIDQLVKVRREVLVAENTGIEGIVRGKSLELSGC
jgi:ATP adenylyltransferase